MSAETYVDVYWTDFGTRINVRTRCSGCGKVVMTEQVAQSCAARIKQHGRHETLRAYLGRCGHWHVGHSNRNRA